MTGKKLSDTCYAYRCKSVARYRAVIDFTQIHKTSRRHDVAYCPFHAWYIAGSIANIRGASVSVQPLEV